jgi:hypothetical protein
VTVTGPDGTAIAHGCSRGQHPWSPEPRDNSPGNPRDGDPPGPDQQQAAQLADLLRQLNVTLTPIARGTCDLMCWTGPSGRTYTTRPTVYDT